MWRVYWKSCTLRCARLEGGRSRPSRRQRRRYLPAGTGYGLWSRALRVRKNCVDLNQSVHRQSRNAKHATCRGSSWKIRGVYLVNRFNISHVFQEYIDLHRIGHGVVDTLHDGLDVVHALVAEPLTACTLQNKVVLEASAAVIANDVADTPERFTTNAVNVEFVDTCTL